jgi:hypothetical protein
MKVDQHTQSIGAVSRRQRPKQLAAKLRLQPFPGIAGGSIDGGEGPRFLLRADEFPYGSAYDKPEYGTGIGQRFHEILRQAEVPYLMAVLPRLARDYLEPSSRGERELDDDELDLLARMRSDGVAFAQHGLDHRSRRRLPHLRSEFAGLSEAQAAALLDEGRAILDSAGIEVCAYVPPFNRFDRLHWPLLRDRYRIVCGGPESIFSMGLQGIGRDGDGIYLPSYPPFYGRSVGILPHVRRLIAQGAPVTVCITLHTIWEVGSHEDELEELAVTIAPHAVDWLRI